MWPLKWNGFSKSLSCISPFLFIYVFMKLFSKFDWISLIISAPLETMKCVIDQKAACRTPLVLYGKCTGNSQKVENTWFTNESFATLMRGEEWKIFSCPGCLVCLNNDRICTICGGSRLVEKTPCAICLSVLMAKEAVDPSLQGLNLLHYGVSLYTEGQRLFSDASASPGYGDQWWRTTRSHEMSS